MGTYEKTCNDCGDTTRTNSWEPTECPFCELEDVQKQLKELPSQELVDALWRDLGEMMEKLKALQDAVIMLDLDNLIEYRYSSNIAALHKLREVLKSQGVSHG